MSQFIITESIEADGHYFVVSDDVSKLFELINESDIRHLAQLSVEASSAAQAQIQVDSMLSSGRLRIINDPLFEDIEEPQSRPLRRGDFVGYSIGSGEQELTYLIVLKPPMNFINLVECYDPWFDAYVMVDVSDLWLMTDREKNMMVNHQDYGMVVIQEVMFKEASRLLNMTGGHHFKRVAKLVK